MQRHMLLPVVHLVDRTRWARVARGAPSGVGLGRLRRQGAQDRSGAAGWFVGRALRASPHGPVRPEQSTTTQPKAREPWSKQGLDR
jgi:hypothetical protein